jgi:hypothetical protein
MRIPHDFMPYGVYLNDTSSVLYDRYYRPLIRLSGQWPKCDHATVVACDPEERIKHTTQFWFYNSDNPPRHSRETRERLKAMVDSIPALGVEIERRARAAKVQS